LVDWSETQLVLGRDSTRIVLPRGDLLVLEVRRPRSFNWTAAVLGAAFAGGGVFALDAAVNGVNSATRNHLDDLIPVFAGGGLLGGLVGGAGFSGRGAALGGVIGAGLGLAVALPSCSGECDAAYPWIVAAASGGAGAIVGGLVARTERWSRVPRIGLATGPGRLALAVRFSLPSGP
jgi:hypothetical protein